MCDDENTYGQHRCSMVKTMVPWGDVYGVPWWPSPKNCHNPSRTSDHGTMAHLDVSETWWIIQPTWEYIYTQYIHTHINMIRPYDIKPLFYGDETSSLDIIFAYARIIMLNMMKNHDIPMLFLCYFYGISMGLLWDYYGISMGFLWDFYGMTMGFLLYSHDICHALVDLVWRNCRWSKFGSICAVSQ